MNTATPDVIPTSTLADIVGRTWVMRADLRPLWAPMPSIAGPAYTVACPPGDNLMLHAAIYRAEPGSVIVVQSGDLQYALAGGNVCAVAQRRGIAAFVLDGLVRDIGEIRVSGFPVIGLGTVPMPGSKSKIGILQRPVHCGGVVVSPGDLVTADEDGVVVVPASEVETTLQVARVKLAKEAAQSLDEWETEHRARISAAMKNG